MKKKICIWAFCLMAFSLFSQEVITYGNAEGDTGLYNPWTFREGPDKNIYIADLQDSYIKVYSLTGKFVRKIGGMGEGPGEMKRMGRFNFTEDGKYLFFTEYFGGHKWITFCTLDGKFSHVTKLEISGSYGLLKSFKIADTFLSRFSPYGPIKKVGDYFHYYFPTSIVLINNQGKISFTLIKQNKVGGISLISDGGTLTVPFQPAFAWDYYQGKLFFSNGLDKKIMIIDLKTNKSVNLLTPLPDPSPVTNQDFKKWKERTRENFKSRGREWFQRLGIVINKYKESVHKIKPNIGSLSITNGGKILISENQTSRNPHKFWLLNQNGKILVKFKSTASNIIVEKDVILFQIMDEEENSRIKGIIRKSTEEEDLKYFQK